MVGVVVPVERSVFRSIRLRSFQGSRYVIAAAQWRCHSVAYRSRQYLPRHEFPAQHTGLDPVTKHYSVVHQELASW